MIKEMKANDIKKKEEKKNQGWKVWKLRNN